MKRPRMLWRFRKVCYVITCISRIHIIRLRPLNPYGQTLLFRLGSINSFNLERPQPTKHLSFVCDPTLSLVRGLLYLITVLQICVYFYEVWHLQLHVITEFYLERIISEEGIDRLYDTTAHLEAFGSKGRFEVGSPDTLRLGSERRILNITNNTSAD